MNIQNFSFRNRIAINYLVATALLTGVVFVVIFVVVRISVSAHLNDDLQREVRRHLQEIVVREGKIGLKRQKEWMEREHNTVGVDPVFIEFVDADGRLIDKSPNLKGSRLLFAPGQEDNVFYDGRLAQKRIRQVKVPILDGGGRVEGRLLVAVAREGSEVVLETLWHILVLTYPIIMLVLFLVTRIIAGKSIRPINGIIDTSNRITKDNLSWRIPLPRHKDELYILSQTINQLLDRIEKAVEREKSFTSYASHEFRTPLAVLKGTLEVLVRKPRGHEEYREKVAFCIHEIDRLNHLVDELLILTRHESLRRSLTFEEVGVAAVVDNMLRYFSESTGRKEIQTKVSLSSPDISLRTDTYIFSTILNNIFSNAVKYSYPGGIIKIDVRQEAGGICCQISDGGIGIPEKDMGLIFDQFYRSEHHAHIKGFGLGLPIVKRFCTLLNIRLEINSREGDGTTVRLHVPQD